MVYNPMNTLTKAVNLPYNPNDPNQKPKLTNLPYNPNTQKPQMSLMSNNATANNAAPQSFEDKYKSNIDGLARYNNVDVGAAKDMLISNLTKGGQYKGGGVLDYNAAAPDAHSYIEQARQKAMSGPSTAGAPAQQAQASKYDYAQQIQKIYDARAAQQLAALKAQRDQYLGDINLQEQKLAPQYQSLKNQAGGGFEQAKQRLREQMAAAGLTSSGENITAMTDLQVALQNSLNNYNLQEQQQHDAFANRRADLLNPSQEESIIAALEAERAKAMLDGQYRADDMNYRDGRDQVSDNFTRGQMTGYLENPEIMAKAQELYRIKEANRYGGNADLVNQANGLRDYLTGQGIDANRLFGADVSPEQALANIAQLRQRTMQGQQFDYQKGIDQRNFNYQIGRDQVGDSRYNNEFAYKQYRDNVGDSQTDRQFNWQQEYQAAGLTGMFRGNPTMSKIQNDQDIDYKKWMQERGITEDNGVKATNGYISQAMGKGSRDEAIRYINENAQAIVNDGGNITQILNALSSKWPNPSNANNDPYGLGK